MKNEAEPVAFPFTLEQEKWLTFTAESLKDTFSTTNASGEPGRSGRASVVERFQRTGWPLAMHCLMTRLSMDSTAAVEMRSSSDS